jgi:beta-glucosidase
MLPEKFRKRVISVYSCILTVLYAVTPNALGGSLSAYDPQVNELLAKMTLDEKIGQMIQAENTGLEDISDVEHYFLGSILSGGSSDPESGNSAADWAGLYESLQARTRKTRLKIPILYGIDAVHGHNNVDGAVIFPHNIGLGCTRNPQLVEEAARITAREVRGTGIQWAFAPCVTVPRDERWGRTYEGFSEDPELVTLLGAAAVRGLQGTDVSAAESVLACAKHFVGDGGTAAGSASNGKGWDQGDTRLNEDQLRQIHLRPYPSAIQAGVGSIMPSYSSWNGVKCSGSRYLLTIVLKEELGFEGFLISDYEAIKQIDPDFKTSIGISINAGMDMAMEPKAYRRFFKYLKELVNEGTVPMSRIDDAVRRILRVKFAMGMMDANYDYRADRQLMEQVGSASHRAVARQAVRESLVLLKNDNKVLPVSKSLSRVHVGGKSADDIGNQCGGWTIEWQGKSGPVISGGTTTLAAIRQSVSADTQVTFSADGRGAEGAEVGVLVIGETPYAEMKGDRADLRLSKEDVKAFQEMKKAGIPVIVILFSGRPMIIHEVLEEADAFIAAWLPGSEGQGIADVLFGDFKPTGKLSFSWPKSMSQVPLNTGDPAYHPMFEYGYGLTYPD